MTPTVNKTTKILGQDEFPSRGFGSAPKININMTMNGSVFNMGKKEDKKEATADDRQKMAHGEEVTKEGKVAAKGASDWGAKCKEFMTNMVSSKEALEVTTGKVDKESQKVTQDVTSNIQKIDTLTKNNEKIDTEIAALESEKAALATDDGTGSGKSSAFSLDLPSGPAKAKSNAPSGQAKTDEPATEEQPEAGDVNAAKIASIDSKIGTLSANSASNTLGIQTATKSTTSSKTIIDNLFNSAAKQLKQTEAETAKAEKSATTANIIGTATTVVGGVTTAVGVALAAGVFTAPAAPPPTAIGAIDAATGKIVTKEAFDLATKAAATAAAKAAAKAALGTKVSALAGLFLAAGTGATQLTAQKKG